MRRIIRLRSVWKILGIEVGSEAMQEISPVAGAELAATVGQLSVAFIRSAMPQIDTSEHVRLLKTNRRRGGREAEGGGLLNRYTG